MKNIATIAIIAIRIRPTNAKGPAVGRVAATVLTSGVAAAVILAVATGWVANKAGNNFKLPVIAKIIAKIITKKIP